MKGMRAVCAVVLVVAGVAITPAAASPPPYALLFVTGADGEDPVVLDDFVTEFGGSLDWSPDASRIAYPSGTRRIYVADTEGSGVHPVTKARDDGGEEVDPDWSPDGARIVFVRDYFQTSDVYVVDVGGDEMRLTSDPTTERHPVWSPDGTRIAFLRWTPQGAGAELVVVAADGSSERVIATGSLRGSPEWSPDGTRLAVTRGDYRAYDVVIVNADGSGEWNLTPGTGDDFDPEWSPDGTRLAFTSGEALAVSDAAGANRVELYPRGFDPSWSPDGASIVFTDGYDVMTIGSDGSAPREVAANPWLRSFHARWSPDGERIAFLVDVRDVRDRCRGTEQGATKPIGGYGVHASGTEGDDELVGTSKSDTFCGYAGADRIAGRDGVDEVFAGAGDDRVAGGAGADWIEGDGTGWRGEAVRPGGGDTLFGGIQNDRLLGGPGDDVLKGGRGRDVLRGAGGRDVCVTGPGRDSVRGCEVVR